MRPIVLVAGACCALLGIWSSPSRAGGANDVIGRFATAWESLRSYTCTATIVETEGSRSQFRVYHIAFQKPLSTRAEVIDGDGRGSVAVWNGGDRVRGHQGGFLSFIKLNLDIHNHLVVSLRKATIAEVNMGWLLQHLQSIDAQNFRVSQHAGDSVLTALVREPAPNSDVVKEAYIFAPTGFPVEGFQYGPLGTVLKHVVYADCRFNVALPPATWQI